MVGRQTGRPVSRVDPDDATDASRGQIAHNSVIDPCVWSVTLSQASLDSPEFITPSYGQYRGCSMPFPTGPLYIGPLVTALASWLGARVHDSMWLMHIEDIDL